jgi:D-arabinose 1-dehydrogenase-like Zn-dependent alcohol dehydrogenase
MAIRSIVRPKIPAILLGYSLSNEGVQITSPEVLENPTDAEWLPNNGQLQSRKSEEYFMSMKMKAAQISKPGGDWELVEREIPEPGTGQVRVKVEACGICHSDFVVKEGLWPGLQFPRVPGHEVAGRIDAVGGNVTAWKKSQRVGVGWHGGHCFVCEQCRRGDFAMCINRKVTGIDFDGGYAEYMIAPAAALALIPEELPAEEAGPFMCAGVTVYNALRNSGARAGDVVAVHGIGGLGHLGVQYARQMGFKTVAVGRGRDKEELAKKLGAHHYIDSGSGDAAAELQKLGGANVILATAPNAQAISALVDGLSAGGKLVMPAAPTEPLAISPMSLFLERRSVLGWYSGTAKDSQDTLEFSALTGVHPMIEKYPLSRVAEAYEQMHSGKVRFRSVLTMGV